MKKLYMNKTTIRALMIISICIVTMLVLAFSGVAIAHMVVFSRADYDKYDSEYFLK